MTEKKYKDCVEFETCLDAVGIEILDNTDAEQYLYFKPSDNVIPAKKSGKNRNLQNIENVNKNRQKEG